MRSIQNTRPASISSVKIAFSGELELLHFLVIDHFLYILKDLLHIGFILQRFAVPIERDIYHTIFALEEFHHIWGSSIGIFILKGQNHIAGRLFLSKLLVLGVHHISVELAEIGRGQRSEEHTSELQSP